MTFSPSESTGYVPYHMKPTLHRAVIWQGLTNPPGKCRYHIRHTSADIPWHGQDRSAGPVGPGLQETACTAGGVALCRPLPTPPCDMSAPVYKQLIATRA